MNRVEVDEFLESLTKRMMRKQKVRMWQACRWKIRNQQLTFEVRGLLFEGVVELSLNEKQDAYEVYLIGRWNTLDKYIPNVDGKDLVDVLDSHIENPKDGTYFTLVKDYAKNGYKKHRM